MEDKFDTYIKNNKDLFDDLTPPSDMWDKISDNIPAKKKNSYIKLVTYISSAAAVLIIAIIVLFQKNTFVNSETSFYSEIQETEMYYNNIVANKKETVYKLTSSTPEIKQDIEHELALLDSAMIELKNDLNDDISNVEVVEAMVQNYRMKLKILEDILKYLKPTEEKPTIKVSEI